MTTPPLDDLTRASQTFIKVMREDLRTGDWILVRTVSSKYRMQMLRNGKVRVSGGWFDRHGRGPTIVGVTGATWGGSAIMPGVLAACGLRVEFSNRLITSSVRTIVVFSAAIQN